MRFNLLHLIFLIFAIAALIAWRMDRIRFEKTIENYGEFQPDSYWKELDFGEVIMSSTIRDIAFVYCYSDFENPNEPPQLADVCSPVEAERNGYPSPTEISLINDLLGYDVLLSLDNIAIREIESEYCHWKITWQIRGYSGAPYEVFGCVLPDGTRVPPRLYLRDYFGSYFSDGKELLSSVMPIRELLPCVNKTMDERQLIAVAEKRLVNSLAQLEIQTKFEFDSITRRTFSSKLVPEHENEANQLEVWAIDFVDRSIPKSVNNDNPATRITVWATSDFQTSQLSVGEWQP